MTFWLRASFGDEAEKSIDQLTTLGIHRIAVFFQDDAFGKAGLTGVDAELGAEVTIVSKSGKLMR